MFLVMTILKSNWSSEKSQNPHPLKAEGAAPGGCVNETELRGILELHIGDSLAKKGQVLYSGIETLARGKFYFIGFNPAIDLSNRPLGTIPLGKTNWSAYRDQCWTCGEWNACKPHGQKRHQKQAIKIMAELGVAQPEKVFATNLVFEESAGIDDVYALDRLHRYWAVHRHLLAEVRPEIIVCFGKQEPRSAFGYLCRVAQRHDPVRTGGGFKRFSGTFDLGHGEPLTATVIGVRHPSYPSRVDGLREFAGV
jgi:hypothetical protein